MKQKWLELDWPKRILLLLQGFLILLFLILYCVIGRQQVIEYRGERLRCRTEDGVTTYSGKLDGQKAVFTVTSGQTVEFRLGDDLYSYTIVTDPTAVPESIPTFITDAGSLVGAEVYEGSKLLFRGSYKAVTYPANALYLFDEDGTMIVSDDKVLSETTSSTGFSTVTTYVSSPIPGAYSILKIALAPGVSSRGSFMGYLLGVLFCLVCAVSILYADRLFRWNLRFMIANPEDAEPSEWELLSRWIGWIGLTICALVIFCMSLNYH